MGGVLNRMARTGADQNRDDIGDHPGRTDFFPMIINSDERQWTWMDEGLNTFVQYLTEKEFDRDYPTRRGCCAGHSQLHGRRQIAHQPHHDQLGIDLPVR